MKQGLMEIGSKSRYSKKMSEFLLGSSGWNYPDTTDKGGWTGVFYPDKNTKRLRYYSQFFNTAEMDSTFHEKFHSQMTKTPFGTSLDVGQYLNSE
jgi:hypothetical protein